MRGCTVWEEIEKFSDTQLADCRAQRAFRVYVKTVLKHKKVFSSCLSSSKRDWTQKAIHSCAVLVMWNYSEESDEKPMKPMNFKLPCSFRALLGFRVWYPSIFFEFLRDAFDT